MFTGIIEDLGIIKKINRNQISVATKLDDIKTGDSICVNGVCLTVVNSSIIHRPSSIVPTSLRPSSLFQADVSEETLSRTNLGKMKPGGKVNLERAMKSDGRFGGHFVTGHIDGTGKITKITKSGNSEIWQFSNTENISRYIVEKGSIAVDGISLTVAEKNKNYFTAAVIPYTLNNTTLGIKKTGDTVNLETDILSKYVLQVPGKKEITLGTLKKAGFR